MLASGVVAGAGFGGFTAGAITGAAAGATGGAISGFGMTALSGGTLGQAFASAGMGALIGGGTGAVLGGTIQGIGAVKQGNNFWTGKPRVPISSGKSPVLKIPESDPKLNTEAMRTQLREMPGNRSNNSKTFLRSGTPLARICNPCSSGSVESS